MRVKIIRATTVSMSLNAFCKGMLRELSGRYDVVAISSPDEDLYSYAKEEGVKAIGIPMERRISLGKDVVSLVRMVKTFRKEKPTMVHSMTPKAGLVCMMAAWLTRVPVRVHTFTGLVFPTSTGLKRRILMLTDALTCFCATHVIPEGEGVKADLQNYGITHKPLKVLGYGNVKGIDLVYFDQRQTVKELAGKMRDASSFTFVFVGRIVRDKGINELCEAFEKLNRLHPQCRLWLVGPYEDSLDPISESARHQIETNPAIQSVGGKFGDELLAYYAAADCFVFPSYREGFPNTVIEAGAMGLPSIVTDINGAREIIVEGENGMIVPPQDSDALFQAMEKLLTDKNSRERMALNARPMVASRFEQGFVRRCLYSYYDEILKPYV